MIVAGHALQMRTKPAPFVLCRSVLQSIISNSSQLQADDVHSHQAVCAPTTAQEERTQLLQAHPQLHQAALVAQQLQDEADEPGTDAGSEGEDEGDELYTDRRWRVVQLQGVGQRWQQLVQQLGPEVARLQAATGEPCW